MVESHSLPLAKAGYMAKRDNGMGPYSSMEKQVLQVKQPHVSVCSPFAEEGGSE